VLQTTPFIANMV